MRDIKNYFDETLETIESNFDEVKKILLEEIPNFCSFLETN